MEQPAPRSVSRRYKGAEIRVTVLDAGFRYDGVEYRSLTAVALQITGYPAISGPAWFGLTDPKAIVMKVKKLAAHAAERATPATTGATDAESANHAE